MMTVFSDATVCEAGRNGRQIVITRNRVKHPHIKPFGMGAEGTPSIGNPYHRLFNYCNTTYIKTEARAVHSGFVPINVLLARSRSCLYIPSLLVNLPLRGSRLQPHARCRRMALESAFLSKPLHAFENMLLVVFSGFRM
jgi:hypothetical protein